MNNNSDLTVCKYCGEMLIRVHKGGHVYCNHCDHDFVQEDYDSDEGKDIRVAECPHCGCDDIKNKAMYGNKCIRCGKSLL